MKKIILLLLVIVCSLSCINNKRDNQIRVEAKHNFNLGKITTEDLIQAKLLSNHEIKLLENSAQKLNWIKNNGSHIVLSEKMIEKYMNPKSSQVLLCSHNQKQLDKLNRASVRHLNN